MGGLLASDDFSDGATPVPSSPAFYLRYDPAWTTLNAMDTGYSIDTERGDLTSAYFAGGNQSLGTNKHAATKSNTSGDHFNPYLWRQQSLDNSIVEATFHSRTITGNAQRDSHYAWGVCIRAQGGTLTNSGTADEYVSGGDAYWFILSKDDANNGALRFFLVRVIAGVATLIDDVAASEMDGSSGSISSILADDGGGADTLRNPVTMYLKATGTGATVTLNAQVSYTKTLQGVPTVVNEAIFNYGDVHSTDRITTPGRCGFGMSQGRDSVASPGNTTVSLCGLLNVYDNSSLISTADDFRRANTDLAAAVSADDLGYAGRNLGHGWAGDWLTTTSPPGEVLMDSGNDRLVVDVTGGPHGFIWSQRVPDTVVDQHWSCTAYYDSTAGDTSYKRAGIMLRGSTTGSMGRDDYSGIRGYLFVLYSKFPSAVFNGYLYSYDGINERVLMAESLAVEVAQPSVVLDANVTIEMKIVSDSGIYGIHSPHITCTADGKDLNFTLLGVDGVVATTAGNVIDTRSDAIQGGGTIGMYVDMDGTLTSPMYLDAWTQETAYTPHEPNTGEGSIVMTSESDSPSGTLTTTLQSPIQVEYLGDMVEHRMDGGFVQRALRDKVQRRMWTSSPSAMPTADKEAIRTFYEARGGTEQPFTWVTPHGESVTVCFVSELLRESLLAPGVFSTQIQLLELF